MRPRSALRRPPSAGPARPPSASITAAKATEQTIDAQRRRIGHQFAHALREKISIHRHAMNLPDAPLQSPSVAELTGETDAEYFSVLRNREDNSRTVVHRLATDAGIGHHNDGAMFSDLLPTLNVEGAKVVDAVAIDGVLTIQLASWTDVDGVVVTDEPRTLRVFPSVPYRSAQNSAKQFAQGSLLLSALGAAGVVDASHDGGGGPRGFSLHVVSRNVLAPALPAHWRHLLLSPSPHLSAVDAFTGDSNNRAGEVNTDNDAWCFVVSLDSFHSKAISVRTASLRPPSSSSFSRTAIATSASTSSSAVRVVCESFSDAELFQWCYLQLALRAHVDAALDPALYLSHSSTASAGSSVGSLRADLIARHHRHHNVQHQHGSTSFRDQHQTLAFEPPDGSAGRYIVFPPTTPVLTLVGLEGIVHGVSSVIATVGDAADGQWTELLGWRDIPVVSSFARHVLTSWASKVRLRDSRDAFAALQQLFDLYYPLYGTTRSALLELRVAPRVFLSGPRAHRRLKKFPFLADHVTAPVRRPSVIPSPSKMSPDVSAALERKLSTTCAPMVVTASHTRVQEECGYLMDRWRTYIGHPLGVDHDTRCGDVSVFESHDDAYLSKVKLMDVLGRGGSGLVFKGMIDHPVYEVPIVVAVKCFIFPDGMDHETYVRECLTDVAFFAVFNEVDACGVAPSGRMYDFFLTSQRLQGMSDDDWKTCLHNQPTDGTVNLCYLITELVDKTVGRFLTAADDDYDPCYDELLNKPFDDLQSFLFLYSQLVLRSQFNNYTVHDLMLNGQLRGDNLGLISIERLVSKEARRRRRLSQPRHHAPLEATPTKERRFVWFQYDNDKLGDNSIAPPKYLKFPLADWNDGTMGGAAYYVVFIDVGQGLFQQVQKLHDRGLIGSPTVESCLTDDNMGRYYPPEDLYAKDITATSEAGKSALALAAKMKVPNADAARTHLTTILTHFADLGYGAVEGEEPSDQDVADRLVWTCTKVSLDHLHNTYSSLKE